MSDTALLGQFVIRDYCAGLALGIVAWCIVQLVPPIRIGRIGTAFVLLAIALGPVLDVAAGRY